MNAQQAKEKAEIVAGVAAATIATYAAGLEQIVGTGGLSTDAPQDRIDAILGVGSVEEDIDSNDPRTWCSPSILRRLAFHINRVADDMAAKAEGGAL